MCAWKQTGNHKSSLPCKRLKICQVYSIPLISLDSSWDDLNMTKNYFHWEISSLIKGNKSFLTREKTFILCLLFYAVIPWKGSVLKGKNYSQWMDQLFRLVAKQFCHPWKTIYFPLWETWKKYNLFHSKASCFFLLEQNPFSEGR